MLTRPDVILLDDQYELLQLVGKGGSAQVFSAVDFNGDNYAIKIIRTDRAYTDERSKHFILRENFVMDRIGYHQNIVQSHLCSTEGTLEYDGRTTTVMYHVLEYCPNGTLANVIKRTGPLLEKFAKFYFYQLVCAVQHLHQKEFAHMDIKLDNILLDKFFNVKLGDLGTAYWVAPSKGQLCVEIGTPGYIAPEVYSSTTGFYEAQKADIYSMGVCLYLMLTGMFPETWDSTSVRSTYDTCSGESMFDDSSVNSIINDELFEFSTEAKELLSEMLQFDPKKRSNINKISQNPWFANTDYASLASEVYEELAFRTGTSATKFTAFEF